MLALLNKSRTKLLLCIGLIACVFGGASYAEDGIANQPQADTEWVVVLKDPRPARLSGFQVKSYSPKHYSNSLELKRFGKRIAKEYELTLKKAWFIESLSVYCLVLKVDNDKLDRLGLLREDERVDWVQPSNSFELLSTSNVFGAERGNQLPGLSSEIDGSGVRIALVDSGVSAKHPELSRSVSVNRDLVIGGEPLSSSGESHGTAMAGILVASPKSGLGLPGVAPAAKVLAYRGCWEGGNGGTQCNTLSLARALDGVAKAQPSILNLSLSGPRDRLLDQLVEKLVKQNIFIVAAFDPKRPTSERFPTRRDGVLIVRAEHLHKDYQDEFTAPGKRIVVSPEANYRTMSGHSVAAAYTSGVLALMAQASEGDAEFALDKLVDEEGRPNVLNVRQLLAIKDSLASCPVNKVDSSQTRIAPIHQTQKAS